LPALHVKTLDWKDACTSMYSQKREILLRDEMPHQTEVNRIEYFRGPLYVC